MPAPPAHSDDTVGQLAEQFTRAFRRMRAGVAAQLSPLGVTFSQARLLRMLARADDPLRVGDIASRLEIAPRSATGMVDALERAGLAQRQPDTVDRRSVLVALTAKGSDLLGSMDDARRSGAEELLGCLSAQKRDQLLDLLVTVNAGAGADDDAPGTEVR